MPETAVRLAPAKVNLFLHVGDRRADGYHDLTSLAVFPSVGDTVSVRHGEGLGLELTGPMAGALVADNSNLVLRAAQALRDWAHKNGHATTGVQLVLDKHLPVASGIGGGSSDAAAALNLLVTQWQLPIHLDDLDRLAASVGADVPVCLRAYSAWMSGRGEVVEAAPSLPSFHVVLANPGVQLATADVFRRLKVRSGAIAPRLPARLDLREFAVWLDRTVNDLSAPARELAPVIMKVEQAIVATPDCLLARMSGSGATCFGIYPDERTASAACSMIRASHPQWWVGQGRVGSS